MVHEISKNNSVFNHYIAEIRDKTVQKDPIRFRKNLERISTIIGYEISKSLDYTKKSIETPLGHSEMNVLTEQPVIASILRAGLTMHSGMLEVFDHAENAFISAYREEVEGATLKVHVEYLAAPSLENKTVILVDPMLATGSSLELVYQGLQKHGTPKNLHVACAIASQPGVDYLVKALPESTHFWIGAIDPELNDKAYIVPGLGDAGDLAFGTKL